MYFYPCGIYMISMQNSYWDILISKCGYVQNDASFGGETPLPLQQMLQDYDEWDLGRRENLVMFRKERENE